MKKVIPTLLLLLILTPGFSQSSKYEYGERFTPSIKKDKLNKAKFINEIMPEFCRYFALQNEERVLFNELLKSNDRLNENYIYPQELYDYPVENYNKVIYFVSIEISATSQGKTLSAKSTSNILTPAQKKILSNADLGSDINIKTKFKFKTLENINTNELKEGKYTVTVVPETEAKYPGGFKELSDYLIKNVISQISKKNSEKIRQAIAKFTVDEKGRIVDAKMSRTSTDPETDKLILDAISKMPTWKPAENTKGIKVRQEFSIPFGGGGC